MKWGLPVLAVILMLAAPGWADEEKDSDDSSYMLSLRVRWWMPVLDGTFQINKGDLRGSYNDFADDLDLDGTSFDPSTNPGGPEVNLTVKILGLHFAVNYVSFNTQGRTVLEDKLTIDVNEYDSGDLIRSDLTLAFGTFEARYDILSFDFFTLAAGLGVSYFDFTTSIVGHDTSTGIDVEISDAGNGIYPILSLVTDISLSYFEARAQVSGIAGDFSALGDIRLTLLEGAFSVHLRPVKYFSIGLGFRVTYMDASAVNIWHGDPDPVRFTLYGIFFEVEGRF
jgi:hypothetical protein